MATCLCFLCCTANCSGSTAKQEESVWFTIYGACWRIGANCVSRSPMYINRIRICGATLTLPAPVAAGWSKFFKQTLIHLIQTEGTTTPLIPAKSDQWLG